MKKETIVEVRMLGMPTVAINYSRERLHVGSVLCSVTIWDRVSTHSFRNILAAGKRATKEAEY